MKIGFLINTSEPFYRGGYERRCWSLARELARQGHEVRIYTSCPREEMREGVRLIPLVPARPYFNRRGVRNGWADVLFAFGILPLYWQLGRGEIEVLDICATPFIHLFDARMLTRFKSIPAVLTCHEALLSSIPAYAQERGHRQSFSVALTAKILTGIYRFGMAVFPKRIAVSQRTAAALAAEGFPASYTIEFGLEADAFRADAPVAFPEGAPRRFVFCGRLTPIKSVEVTLQALFLINKESPRAFHFDIIGDGSERARLEEMVRDAGASDLVTFHGEVLEARKLELLRQAEVFVLSSPREGFSIATLEAMAQGCAALVVSDPQNPSGALDFVRHDMSGIVVSPGVDNLRTALLLFMKDASAVQRLRLGAWQRAQDYRIEKQARLLVEAYAAIVRSSS